MNEEKATILAVDDIVENIDILYNILHENYEMKVAKSGVQALKLLEKEKLPDLILLDVMMPEMDGHETIKLLKKNPQTSDIPVIFLTSKTEEEDVVKGFDLGAVDYVAKPFNASELMARVRTQLTIKNHEHMIKQSSKELKEMLHIISHDLANHFSVIQIALEILDIGENKNIEKSKDLIRIATKNGIDVISLVREMRSVEDKKLPLQRINLISAINDSIKLISDKINSKKITIDIDIPDDFYIMAEPRSFINSVINNIFTNAIKFSYKDSTIVVSAEKTEKDICITFKDSGIGIPGNLLDQLFELTKQTNRNGTSGEKGTGFGMPLIKKFVELYGGRIEVNSREAEQDPKNHGTEIILYLNGI